jgi:uncharacterized protein YbjT (DUF2867 family)
MSAEAPKKDDHDHAKKDEHHKKEEVKSTIPPKTIAVVGGTGSVGHSVALHLAKYQHSHHTAHKFHIGVRDVKSAKSIELAKHHDLAVATADMGKPATVSDFLKATDVALLVTPGAENRAALTKDAADAAKKAGVKHILVISVTSAEKDILFGKQFSDIENHVKKLGTAYTIVRLPFFTDNLMGNKQSIVSSMTFYAPVNGDSKFDCVSVDDVGSFFAALMAGPDLDKYNGKTLNCTGPDAVTHNEIAAWFGESLKKDAKAVKFVTAKPEDALKGMVGSGYPEWQAKGVLELYALMDKKDPVISLVTDDFKHVVGHKSHSPSTWIGHQGHNFIPHPEEHHAKKDDAKKDDAAKK